MGMVDRLNREHERPAATAGFERFFRAQYPVVVHIAWDVVRDRHLAEDVAQDVMIAAQRRFDDLTDNDHAVAWVRTAAVHRGLNEVRGRKRRARREKPEAGGASGPEDLAVSREADSEVRRALGALPLKSATVLLLRHSGLSYAEIASSMEVKVSHVGSMLRRAEQALRKELDRATRV